jgi:DNA mismatch repair protein MutL
VWPAVADLLDRVAAVAGEEEASALVAVEREEGPARLRGFVSRPDRHRPTLAGVRLFVNGRAIRDRLIQHALVEVYRDVLPRGRFPSALLFLELPPERVDVNVHPAKWEVRFAEPQAIHRLVRHAAEAALGARQWLGAAAVRRGPAAAGGGPHAAAGEGDWVFARPYGAEPVAGAPGAGGTAASAAPARGPEAAAALPGLSPAAGAPVRFGDLRLLGQLLATYLVLETKAGLLLVDQHAAHERVLYERLRAEWRKGALERQALLLPATLQLEPSRLRALLEARAVLERMGFEVDAFGEATAAVRALPALLAQRDPAALVRDLADELVAAGPAAAALCESRRAPEAAERLFAGLACHSARRKGDLLPAAEQHALLDALDAIPWAPTCPHGRPVAVPFELSEIERRFARR